MITRLLFRSIVLLSVSLVAFTSTGQDKSDIPNMFFEIGMTTKDSPGNIHLLQFTSNHGECDLIEITISDALFYVDRLSTRDQNIEVTRTYGKNEFMIRYLNLPSGSKSFIFTFDDDRYLQSITGSATNITKPVRGDKNTVYSDVYIEMKRNGVHFIPITLKTVLPGIYP